MSSKFKKMIKCLIAFSFIFTIVGCKSTKSEDEMKKIIKKENLYYREYPYYKDQNVELGVTDNKKYFIYDKDGLKYEDLDTMGISDDYELLDKITDEDKKKSYQDFLKKYDFTEDDLENYLKNQYEKSISKYNKLSYKEKFAYVWEGNEFDDNERNDGKEFLKELSEKNIKKLYKSLMKNEERIDVSIDTLKEEYYKEIDAPEDIKNAINNLDSVLSDNIDYPHFYFDRVVKDGDETTIYYSINPSTNSISGKYSFSYDNNGNFTSLALLYSNYNSVDAACVYAGYLVYACEEDVDDEYDGTVVAINSYNTVYEKNGFSHSLVLTGNTDGFLMKPLN